MAEAEAEPVSGAEPVAEAEPASGSVPRSSSRSADRSRRLAEIFGDVLPDSTADDRDQPTAARGDDTWYTENRPPHHDAR